MTHLEVLDSSGVGSNNAKVQSCFWLTLQQWPLQLDAAIRSDDGHCKGAGHQLKLDVLRHCCQAVQLQLASDVQLTARCQLKCCRCCGE